MSGSCEKELRQKGKLGQVVGTTRFQSLYVPDKLARESMSYSRGFRRKAGEMGDRSGLNRIPAK